MESIHVDAMPSELTDDVEERAPHVSNRVHRFEVRGLEASPRLQTLLQSNLDTARQLTRLRARTHDLQVAMRVDPPTGQELEGSRDGQDAPSELATRSDRGREVATPFESERDVEAERIRHGGSAMPTPSHRRPELVT